MSAAPEDQPPETIHEMLDRFEEVAAEARDEVSVDALIEVTGRRSFGPLLLLAGIVLSTPGISDIPGVPTISGVFILLVSGQILCGRKEVWLPGWLLRREVSSRRVKKMARSPWIRKPAGWMDRFTARRLKALAGRRMHRVVAAVATLLALLSPLTEVVPLSSMGVGAAVLIFGISLIAHDGLMTLIGLLISAATVSLAVAAVG